MAEKFTISEVYADESNRIQASDTEPMKDDTLMLVSENDGGDYRTKALDYGTLYSSLCASMNLEGIVNDIQTNQGDALGISGEYPCFFEMYSSEHYCTPQGGSESFHIGDIKEDTGTMTGLFGKIWSGDGLLSSITSCGTLDQNLIIDDNNKSQITPNSLNSPLSTYTCLKPFKLFKNQYPDPQLVSIMVVSKQSFGIYVDHVIGSAQTSSDNQRLWQRMPIFTYNPDTTSDYITTYKFILAPGSRFGIFGKSAGFFTNTTNVVFMLTNTKGFAEEQNLMMKFIQGSEHSTSCVFSIDSPDTVPATYKVFGPISGAKNGATGVISLQMKQGNNKWTTVASKIYSATANTYVDFGQVYVERGMSFRFWNSGKNIKTIGTTLIGGKTYTNGNLYFEKVEGASAPQLDNVLKLKFKNGRTPSNNIGYNIQFQITGSNGQNVLQHVKVGDNTVYRTTHGDQDVRFYQDGSVDTYELSIDCSNLPRRNPLQMYVTKPIVNSQTEFASSTIYDGRYSGIESIDGTESKITFLSKQFAYNCANLKRVTFGSELTSISAQAFEKCSSLIDVSVPCVKIVSTNAFNGCKSLSGFNVSDTYSIISSDVAIGKGAFDSVGIKNLSVSTDTKIDKGFIVADAFTNLSLDNCIINFNYDNNAGYKNLAFSKTKIHNLCVQYNNLWTQDGNTLPLMANTCTVDNLSIIGNGSILNAKLYSYSPKVVNIQGLCNLLIGGLSASKTLTELDTLSTNIPSKFCQNCISVDTVSITNGTIGDSAFSGCTGINWLQLSDVTSIGDSAFSGCTSLATVVLSSLSSIGTQAFCNCVNFEGEGGRYKAVKLPNITTFGNNAVFQNTAIENVLFGSGLSTAINNKTFKDCKNLKGLYFSHKNTPENHRLLYSILVNEVPKSNFIKDTTVTSNICIGCPNKVMVYCNCGEIDDGNEVLFAEIFSDSRKSTITFRMDI